MAIDPMKEIRASFFGECDELVERLQDALNHMADGTSDAETINDVFRAVHSIKGGAGAFDLTALVAFAHRFETVMDALRSGSIAADNALIKGLFQATDGLIDVIAAARDDGPCPPGSDATLALIEAFLPEGAPRSPDGPEPVGFEPLAMTLQLGDMPAPGLSTADAIQPETGGDPAAAASQDPGWVIFFRPHAALYASGNEPLLLLSALRRLGTLTVDCDVSGLPDWADLQAEDAYLSWTLTLISTAAEDEVLDVFDFVTDVCDLNLSRTGEVAGVCPGQPSGKAAGDTRSWGTRTPDRQAGNDAISQIGPAPAPDPLPQAAADRAPSEAAATVRVDLDRIDRLVNLVGEIVINHAMLAQCIARAGIDRNSDVARGLDAVIALTRDVQDSVMMIRAQPVKPLFQRMARIVREASAAVGKDVRLVTEGEATEIDKTVIERLSDPLTHIIRNAVDHGLERPDVRVATGKSPLGTITLRAQHRSGRVLIEVSDDGGGIDRPKVLDIARRKGLIADDAAPGDAEIDALLFQPGFSTSATVTALSGRGVGMDVVKRAVQSLGGRIAVRSEPGQGTTLSISLPLTLAVLDGMLVGVGDQTMVVPLAAIIETSKLTPDDLCPLAGSGMVARLRGEFMPLCDLGAELGFRSPLGTGEGCIVLLTQTDDGSRAALIVDTIIEQRQVVIKGLERTFGSIPGVAAATILGDGQIALILDPSEIVRQSRIRGGTARQPDEFRLSGNLQRAG